uniref:DDE Tnp4 domain-containing protein n=1 Tax=Cucumis melo TaxID=3656 RepID=A0A9I9EDE0_CUCME
MINVGSVLRWAWYKFNVFELNNCLGALDGTYIKVNVPAIERLTFRTYKEEIATIVLSVCDTKGDFVYVLIDWEGFAVDSRILRDVLSRGNRLQVPKGHYYLCDASYPNAEGFLAPYRGQRYYLQEWRGAENALTNAKEYFNMKHSSTRMSLSAPSVLLRVVGPFFVGSHTILCKSSVAPY